MKIIGRNLQARGKQLRTNTSKKAKLDAKYKEIRIAQIAMDNELELKLFRELEEIENG